MKGKKIFLLLGIFLILSVCFFGCSSEGDNDKQAKETNGAVLESSLPDIDAFATGTMVPETMNPSDAVTDAIFGEQTSTPTFVSDDLSTEAPTDNVDEPVEDEGSPLMIIIIVCAIVAVVAIFAVVIVTGKKKKQ